MQKIIDKLIDLTSLVEIDENGVEHKKPWTLEEFVTGQILMSIGGIIGAIFFWIIILKNIIIIWWIKRNKI